MTTAGRFVVTDGDPDEETIHLQVTAAMHDANLILAIMGDAMAFSVHRAKLLEAWRSFENLDRLVVVWTHGLDGQEAADQRTVAEALTLGTCEVASVYEAAIKWLREQLLAGTDHN